MDDDYGYFGKGSSGYAHYNQSQKSGGGGGNIGCSTWGLIFCGLYVLFLLIGSCRS